MRIAHVLVAAVLLTACPESQIDKKPAATVKEASKDAKVDAPKADAAGPQLDAAASTIGFVGAKLSDDHEGKFEKFTASLTLDGDKPKSLQLDVEVGSLKVDPDKLRGHLLSADFFDAEKFPSAKFSSTAVKDGTAPATHTIEGNLELRGKTMAVSFPATIAVDAKSAKGKAEFTINRKDFGIVYPGMPDDLIKDEVLLKIDLAFKR